MGGNYYMRIGPGPMNRVAAAEVAGSEVTMDIKYEKKIFSEVKNRTVRVRRGRIGRVRLGPKLQ